jgi:hypothetical protein
LLKKHVSDSKAKAKREKTVITGDMKPMIDSLLQAGKLTTISKNKNSKNPTSTNNLLSSLVTDDSKIKNEQQNLIKQNRKETHEKNVERENSKPIMRESVRNKKL